MHFLFITTSVCLFSLNPGNQHNAVTGTMRQDFRLPPGIAGQYPIPKVTRQARRGQYHWVCALFRAQGTALTRDRYQYVGDSFTVPGKRGLTAIGLSCCIGISSPGYGDSAGPAPHHAGVEQSGYNLESLNDFYFGKDQELSGAWALQAHTAVADSWEALEKVPDFIRRWGALIPALGDGQRVYRVSAGIGQITQTPVDLKHRDLIEEDVPYAGALLASLSWYGFSNDAFAGLEFVTGVVGPASGVGDVQQASHKLLGITEPKGWDNQLRNELIINFNYLRKRKLASFEYASERSSDITLGGRVCLGNLITQAGASVEMRYGVNMPGGFVYVPDPIGYDMTYKAALAPPNPAAPSFYGSVVLRAVGVARDIFLDGNTFRHSHSVDSKTFVGSAILGLHYETKNWSAHLSVILPTDTVDTSSATEVEGRGELAAVAIEWRG